MIDYWAVRQDEDIDVAPLYSIEKSAYLAGLSGNAVSSFNGKLSHWLVAGNNQCVEVITYAENCPTVVETERY
ncbi:hypothetical protein [Erythrobacter sp. YT30]|uniref:hypothetical protein n=1 Tax=Erythrobacter sp. YT30 TaxID=1735012 RepID=UPI0012E3F3DC|nr:hypothetical protein [Erythrobacter sp. YT30]